MAARDPGATAILSGDRAISYGELVSRSDRLAKQINAPHNSSDRILAICTRDATQFIIAALGAWRADWAYLPLDPNWPSARLGHLLSETRTSCLVIGKANQRRFETLAPRTIVPDELGETDAITFNEKDTKGWNIARNDPAYVIYTSGSSGSPKGALITHSNVDNLIEWYLDAFEITASDRASQIMALTFDVSVIEMWPILTAGGCVCLCDRELLLFPERLRDHLVQQEITTCQVPALVAERLIELDWPTDTKLRYLHTGGETLHTFPPPELPFRVVNNYGVTECTVVATSTILAPMRKPNRGVPSIGRPINRTRIRICDAELRPVTQGQVGEIVIEGAVVGGGYLHRPQLTQERYICDDSASRFTMYRTGDLGRELPNGEYECCGRIDDQMKVRGHRIEPDEIVAILRSHKSVSNCAIVAVGEGATKRLMAYVVLHCEDPEIDLKAFLETRLPDYMIPEVFVKVNCLPMTAHGKTDITALPDPNRDNISGR